jgi:hypothetical protein
MFFRIFIENPITIQIPHSREPKKKKKHVDQTETGMRGNYFGFIFIMIVWLTVSWPFDRTALLMMMMTFPRLLLSNTILLLTMMTPLIMMMMMIIRIRSFE